MQILSIPQAFETRGDLIGTSPFKLTDNGFNMINKPRHTGNGYLTGQAPNGLVTLDGAPVIAEIRIVYRASSDIDYTDGAIIAKTTSSETGEWIITGLNPNLKYDVISRLEGYNDIIVSNVSPSV